MTRWVVVRDDDANAFTPPACLELLYGPALQAGTPVSLAVIPAVTTGAVTASGAPEGFLWGHEGVARLAPMGEAVELVGWLRERPLVEVVQHGYCHEPFELDSRDRADVARRLDAGGHALREAGLTPSPAFVAPYDRLSRVAFEEVGRRFALVSTGWFEAGRVPAAWWPAYLRMRVARRAHWRTGGMTLLSHPGCLLSRDRPTAGMMDSVRAAVRARRLTVLVTHWWEYFRDGEPDQGLVATLHEALDWLAREPDVRVVSFGEVAAGRVPLD